MDQYARSVITPRSRTGPISLKNTKSVFKNVVQTEKQEWKNQPSGAPELVRREVSGERERTGSTNSLRSRQTEAGTNSGPDAEAERFWQDTGTGEDDDNRSIVSKAASLKRMETGSRAGSRKAPAIYIINTNDFFVQLKR